MKYTVKLSFENATRLASFNSQPTWPQLAAHIEKCFHIPPPCAAAKYTDTDGDEITINSDEELREYYDSEPQTVRLTVHRLQDATPVDQGGNESRQTVKPEAEGGSDGDDSDQDSDGSPARSRKSRARARSRSPSDDDPTPPPSEGKGKQKRSSSVAASKGKGKTKAKAKGRKGGRAVQQKEAASPERAASSNRTRGGHHQRAPSGPERGRHQHDNNQDVDDSDDDSDDVGDVSVDVQIDLSDDGNDSNSGSSSSSSSSSDSDDDAPRRGSGKTKTKKKGGKRWQQDSRQDAAGPFNADPWGNGFANPPPMWAGSFPGQSGGGFGWSSQGSSSRPRSNVFEDVSKEAASHFPGFDFKSWQVNPNAVSDMFSNMRTGGGLFGTI